MALLCIMGTDESRHHVNSYGKMVSYCGLCSHKKSNHPQPMPVIHIQFEHVVF